MTATPSATPSPAHRSRLPSQVARMRGCKISSSVLRAASSPKTNSATRPRSSEPSAPSTSFPNASAMACSAGWPSSTDSRAITSESEIFAPRLANSSAAVDLPIPMPPVRPKRIIAAIKKPPFGWPSPNRDSASRRWQTAPLHTLGQAPGQHLPPGQARPRQPAAPACCSRG